jgi:hypothetical protein
VGLKPIDSTVSLIFYLSATQIKKKKGKREHEPNTQEVNGDIKRKGFLKFTGLLPANFVVTLVHFIQKWDLLEVPSR